MSETRLDALKRFLEQDPNDSFTRYALAMEYVSMNNIAEATNQLTLITRLNPEYVPAYHQLGILFSQVGNNEESEKLFLAGIQAAKNTGDAHALSEMQEALEELREK